MEGTVPDDGRTGWEGKALLSLIEGLADRNPAHPTTEKALTALRDSLGAKALLLLVFEKDLPLRAASGPGLLVSTLLTAPLPPDPSGAAEALTALLPITKAEGLTLRVFPGQTDSSEERRVLLFLFFPRDEILSPPGRPVPPMLVSRLGALLLHCREEASPLRTLLEVGRRLREAGNENEKEVLSFVAGVLADTFSLALVWIGRRRQGEGRIEILARAGPKSPATETIHFLETSGDGFPRTLVGRALESGQVAVIEDLDAEAGLTVWGERGDILGLGSGLADSARMADGSQVVIVLYRERKGAFSGEFLSMVSGLAGDVASFFDQRRVEGERRSLASYQEAVRRAQQSFIEAGDRGQMYRSLVETIVRYAGAIGSYVSVRGADGSLKTEAVETLDPEMSEAARNLYFTKEEMEVFGPSLFSLAFRERRPQGPVSAREWPFLQEMQRRFPVLVRIESAMAFPVILEKDREPAAVFVVWSGERGHFTESLKELLATLAESLGRAIRRLDLDERISRLSLVTRETDDAVCVLGSDGRIEWANAAFTRLADVPSESLPGSDPVHLFASQGAPEEAIERIRSAIRIARPFAETLALSPSGTSSSWLLLRGFPLTEPGGAFRGYGLVASDITKIREASIQKEIAGLFQEALSGTMQALREDSPSLESFLGSLADRLFSVLRPEVLLLARIPGGRSTPEPLLRRGKGEEWFSGMDGAPDLATLFGGSSAFELMEREGGRVLRLSEEKLPEILDARAKSLGIAGALVASSLGKEGDRVFLVAWFSSARFLGDQWIAPFQRIAMEIAQGLDRRHLEEKVRRVTVFQEAVRASQQDFLSARTRSNLFQTFVQRIAGVTDALAAYVLERGNGTKELVMSAHATREVGLIDAMKELRFPLEEGRESLSVVARAWIERKVRLERLSEGLLALRFYRNAHPELSLVREILAAPVLLPGSPEPSAVIALWSAREGTFSEDHLRLAEQLAQSLAIALERLDREADLERLSLVAQKTTDGILLTDPSGLILWVNRAFEEKYGYKLAEIRGRFPADFRLGGSTDPETLARIRSHVALHRSFEETMVHYSRSGEPFWVRVNATALFSQDGTPAGYVSVETDVTALKESEERARIASLFYRALSESVQILREKDDFPEEEVLKELLERLRETLSARFVLLGRLSGGSSRISRPLASLSPDLQGKGASADTLAETLTPVEGSGMAAMALRTGRPQILLNEEPDFPGGNMDGSARKYGSLSVSGSRLTGEKILLHAQFEDDTFLGQNSAVLFQRIVVEAVAYLDRKERNRRERRRAHAQVVGQRILSELFLAKTEEEVYRILAGTISSEPGVLFVDLLVPGPRSLERKIISGELSQAILALPPPPLHPPEEGAIPLPTRVFHSGKPAVSIHPSEDPTMIESYHTQPLAQLGIVTGWPIRRPEGEVLAVLAMGARDPEPFSDSVVLDLMEELSLRAAFAIDRIRLLAKLEDLSVHDPLTGLLNRRGMGLAMRSFLASVERRKTLGLVGILDLDDFKPVNDTYGHAVGDRLLVEISARLRETLRESDLVGRLGGDEFVVAAEIPDRAHLPILMERLSRSVEAPYILPEGSGVSLSVGVSLGAVLYPVTKGDPDLLLRHADLALYEIKRLKGHRTLWWKLWEKD